MLCVMLGYKDLEELISLLREAPPGRMVRCSKARAMFASRACRSSVMVGDTLSPAQMASVSPSSAPFAPDFLAKGSKGADCCVGQTVRHMGMMDQPWNCPHGRPTMRHLASMPAPTFAVKDCGGQRVVEWGKLVE